MTDKNKELLNCIIDGYCVEDIKEKMIWQTFIKRYQLEYCFDLQFELLRIYKTHPEILENIKNNFQKIWLNTNFTGPIDYVQFLYCLGDCPGMGKVFEQHLHLILNASKNYLLHQVLPILIESGVVIEENEYFHSIIVDYLAKWDLIQCRKLLSSYKFTKVQEYESYIYLMIEKVIDYYSEENNKNLYYQLICCLIDDLKRLNEQDKNMTQNFVSYCNSGSYSDCFQVGNYILKIGKRRAYQINQDYHHFVQRIYYKEFEQNNLVIEIVPLCDLQNITTEDVKKMYFFARDDHCLWIDARENNLGRLIENSVDLFPNISPLGQKFLGIFPYRSQSKGDLVIIDLDYFINFNSLSDESREKFIINYIKELKEINYYEPFEIAYQNEKSKKQKNHHKVLTNKIK